MGFVPRLYNNTLYFIGIMCLFLLAPASFASTKILVWGDSLSAAYGIPVEKGWVSLLDKSLGENIEVINGSISGETTQGGLSRLPSALNNHSPDLIILELGANDGLRGISPRVTKSNLEQMIQQSNQANAEVILLGMKIPPNYGPIYSNMFEAQFSELADKYKLPFIPFFLEKVILDPTLIQADQLHPTADAQPILLDAILPTLKNVLQNKNKVNAEHNIEKISTEEKIKNPA